MINAVPHHHRTPYRRREERLERQRRGQQYERPSLWRLFKAAWNDVDDVCRRVPFSMVNVLLIGIVALVMTAIALGAGRG